MSSRLSFNIARTRFRPDIEDSVRKTFRTEIGTSFVYPVAVSFKTSARWSEPLLMIYDTGATVTLLPTRYGDAFEVKTSVPIILGGVVPRARLNASLTRLKLRFEDGDGKTSPEIEAWVAVAERDDVPPVLGMKDISTTHKLVVNPEEGKFYLEFK
ncbi:MAG: hypothetical protein HY619_02065 [Thaumarchaeota archaeon]|nr:hypothetical protein [Nitrososphaerota archaeon]